MAGGTVRLAEIEQGIRITIGRHPFDVQVVPGGPPLFHSSRRLRLQNQAVWVFRVSSTASRLVKPSMSTSPVSASWMITGIRSDFTKSWSRSNAMFLHLTGMFLVRRKSFTWGTVNAPKWNREAASAASQPVSSKTWAKCARLPQPPEADDRDPHRAGDRRRHGQVEARLGPVGVHGGEQDLPGAQFLPPAGPRPRRPVRGLAPPWTTPRTCRPHGFWRRWPAPRTESRTAPRPGRSAWGRPPRRS